MDEKCAPEGTPPAKLPADGPQNAVKNNFCTKSNTPETITVQKVTLLQGSANTAEANLKDTPGEPPPNRDFLTKLGEGNLVVFEGYVFHARQECKESVNCELDVPNENAFHDIHIALLGKPRQTKATSAKKQQDAEECTGFVAEMIPHHRPPEWTECNVNDVANKGLRVRVTGQQFFDGSHVACKNGVPVGSDPKRVSLWEIHPIYQFDVCPSGDCATGGWVPLEQFEANKASCPEAKCDVAEAPKPH
jgi:hypothetical protein